MIVDFLLRCGSENKIGQNYTKERVYLELCSKVLGRKSVLLQIYSLVVGSLYTTHFSYNINFVGFIHTVGVIRERERFHFTLPSG